MIEFNDTNKQTISNLICYLEHNRYLKINPKYIGKFDMLVDKFATIQKRKEEW